MVKFYRLARLGGVFQRPTNAVGLHLVRCDPLTAELTSAGAMLGAYKKARQVSPPGFRIRSSPKGHLIVATALTPESYKQAYSTLFE